jgi:hypothetical protein
MLLHDDDSTGQPHVDPDRIPTPLEVPLTMREIVYGDELDAELQQHAEAGQ